MLDHATMIADYLTDCGYRAEVREAGSVRVSLEARRVTLAEVEEILDGEEMPWCKCLACGGVVLVDVEGAV